MKNIVIPSPLQITMDDLGWFCGTDGREELEPARSGVTRRHVAEDYKVVNEIGRRLGMKINCAFIMGEWDPDNRLRNIPCLSPRGLNWNNAATFDSEEAKRCVDVINSSEYIDFAVHGLHHTYYLPDCKYNNTDYYYTKDNQLFAVDENEIRMRLDAYFDLIEYHGFKKSINSFIPPNFTYIPNHITKILRDYNIIYASTTFRKISHQDYTQRVAVDNGIIVVERNNNLIPWNEMESKLDNLPVVSGIFGCHWANVCHKNPQENFSLIDSWINYFTCCKNTFGIILSRDIAFCSTQTLYQKYSKLSFNNDKCIIDLTDVPQAEGLGSAFYISTDKPLSKWTGCDVKIYEKCGEFINYEVTPKSSVLTLM